MKHWEFQCPKCAFIELLQEYRDKPGNLAPLTDKEIEEFVDRFLKNHFQDYNPGHEN